MALRLRRGTNVERGLITPADGELVYTTDTKRLYVGDGTTVGGNPVDTAGTAFGSNLDLNKPRVDVKLSFFCVDGGRGYCTFNPD